MFYAPPSTVLSVFAKGRGSAKTASRPFRFRKSAPKSEKRRPSLLRNRPSCLPIRRDSGRRSRSGASPFGAQKKGGAPPLIGGFRKDKPKKRPRIRKTTRVYAVVCSPQQRLFMCGHYAHPPSGHARFSARGYSFDAHGTDGRRGLDFAGLPRGLQAHPPENNIFLRTKPNAPARRAVPARGRRCCRPVRPTSIFAVSFEKTPQRADRTIANILAPVRGDAAPRMTRPHTGAQVTAASACPAARLCRAF